jgi:hypothetical protein
MKEDERERVCSAHGEMSNAYKFWLVSLRGREYSGGLDVNGRTILKWNVGN